MTSYERDLRDKIALKALEIFLQEENDFEEEQLRREDYRAFVEHYANSAYEIADAMLRARNPSDEI